MFLYLFNMINIRNITDPNYRYKMSPIDSYQTSNGCFTIIKNLDIIASQLGHNPKTILKFMALSLGCKDIPDKMAVSGQFSQENLQELIYNYVNSFVLCKRCLIPELEYKDTSKKKNKILHHHCLSCGYTYEIYSKDLTRKYQKTLEKIIIDVNNNLLKSIKTKSIQKNIIDNKLTEESKDFSIDKKLRVPDTFEDDLF